MISNKSWVMMYEALASQVKYIEILHPYTNEIYYRTDAFEIQASASGILITNVLIEPDSPYYIGRIVVYDESDDILITLNNNEHFNISTRKFEKHEKILIENITITR